MDKWRLHQAHQSPQTDIEIKQHENNFAIFVYWKELFNQFNNVFAA